MSRATIEEILAPKPEARLRIYAYSIADAAHQGLLTIGQTARGCNGWPTANLAPEAGTSRLP